MLAQVFKGFENLELITLDFGGAKRTIKNNLTFWSLPFHYALERIETPSNLRVLYDRGFFEITWSGKSANNDEIFIEDCRPENVPFWLDGYLTQRDPKFFCASSVEIWKCAELFGDHLECLELLDILEMGQNLKTLRELCIVGCFTADRGATWVLMCKSLQEHVQLQRLEFVGMEGCVSIGMATENLMVDPEFLRWSTRLA
ncbi:hypothetical protein JOL62DRAFT_168245 [Phyllosticta paracitricarpa]|uniref:Uncharacterized protein n=2 Tax=Phyllosticta TaxID=121621 RepID=A0ABR1MLV6_9PEZI